MIGESETRQLIGATAYDNTGSKLGKVGQVFLDDQSGRPEFMTVNTGLLGTKESFVPVAEATLDGDKVTVPFSKDQVKDAPNVDIDAGHMDEAEEQELFSYYSMGARGGDVDANARPGTADERTDTSRGPGEDTEGYDTSGPTTDDAMTRSEEKVRVGTASEETGRVRLRKYVTTETETHTVPVKKERAVLEREPVTEANHGEAVDGPPISEGEHEVVLHEERAVVDKTVEPVERVRLDTETTTDEEAVSEEVRKEHIETEGDVDDRR